MNLSELSRFRVQGFDAAWNEMEDWTFHGLNATEACSIVAKWCMQKQRERINCPFDGGVDLGCTSVTITEEQP